MRRIALRSLVHDKSRLAAALAGVLFAALLATVQSALYEGFLYTTSNVITRFGGDVWVTARGVRVLDNAEPLAAGTYASVASHPCVARARPLVFSYTFIHTSHGSRENLRVVGTDLREPTLPWDFALGLPQDLAAPGRVAVDELDLPWLGVVGAPIGQKLALRGRTVTIAAVTRRARSFTLMPFLFARTDEARKLSGLGDGQVSAWVLDLKQPSCADDVVQAIEQNPQLTARSSATLRAETQAFWIGSSGAGAILAFSALMALVVGGVIVGQTLYSSVRDHERELSALRAIGASPWEVTGFVAWQAGVLTVVGGAAGLGCAALLGPLAERGGIELTLSASVLVKSVLVIVVMAVVASLISVRRVLRIDPAKVFR